MRRIIPTIEQTPSGICECGCGERTDIAKATYQARRHFKGYPLPLKRGHRHQLYGEDHWRWKGGRYVHKSGYVFVLRRDHPKADASGYVSEHRLIVEEALGRELLPTEHVHHINGIKDDNRPENLVALTTKEHAAIHGPQRTYDVERLRAIGKKGAEARWGASGERRGRQRSVSRSP